MRFVDNFSAGTRGAASAEYFLEHNYAVIFMYRAKSLEPFTRHFNGQKFLDMLELNDKGPNTTITGMIVRFYIGMTDRSGENCRKYVLSVNESVRCGELANETEMIVGAAEIVFSRTLHFSTVS